MEAAVAFGSWIRRPENVNLVVLGKLRRGGSSPAVIEIFSFDQKTTSLSSSPLVTHEFDETDGDPSVIAVHPSGDNFVCSTSTGSCKLFELHSEEAYTNLLTKELPPLKDVGIQKCLAFSTDGSRFAAGGLDGHLRILEWPSLRIILDEPRAHKSFRDMDFSLDSEYLASTSTDGSARIWKAEEGIPLTTLTRKPDESIELCRFSMDGTKPFLFCTVQKGDKAITVVWDLSTWNRVGYKRLLRKPAAIMSMSLDGKYLTQGSKDGDVCVVDIKKMEVSHWSRRLHLGTPITSLEFCPSERVVLTSSNQWGAMVTKLSVPAHWKEWQVYLVLLGMFLASLVAFYILYENSDSFWNFPLRRDQRGRPKMGTILGDPQPSDDNAMLDSGLTLDL
ncbi:hypothetical protein SAY86_004983 [Trapa natans]|uniref:SEC12-like protein 1 n=1 Tax=Trapa natans TaxID=22666 RepID=A0AAN7L094_TRANT|nr:hypothetical protein SAY86_004983 [Trapa natans]